MDRVRVLVWTSGFVCWLVDEPARRIIDFRLAESQNRPGSIE